MVFFQGGGHIRPPALDGLGGTANNLARLMRRGRTTQERPHFVLSLQHQQRSSPSSRARSAVLSGPGVLPGVDGAFVSSSWQPALAAADLPVTTHPAGDEGAAAAEARNSGNNNQSSGHRHDGGQSSQELHSSGSHALPEELLLLADALAPVSLPPPHTVPPGSLDNRELDKLVGTLGRNKATWRRALVLSQWLQESGHVLDDRLCTTLIRVCSEHGQAVTALSVYEWMKAPAAVGGAGLGPTVYTYTAAMRAALAAGLLDRALQVWEDSQAAHCQLDCRLCITYIEVCSRKGLTDRALSMYAAMKAAPRGSKLAPTVHAYTAAMRAATEGGLWAKALSIWDDMKAAGVTPTGHAFAAAMSACAAGSNWQQAVSLFEDMCAAGIKPDVVSCTALISALAAAGQWQRGESVVQWMLTTGVRPNVRTFTALLTALGNARQWDRAFEMLSLMQHSSWGGVTPNAYTYSALLKALGECGEWQRAEQLFSMLEQQALGPPGSSSSTRQGQGQAAAAAAASTAAWQQSAAAAAAAVAAAAASGIGGGVDAEGTPGVWGWQPAGSSNMRLIQHHPSAPVDQGGLADLSFTTGELDAVGVSGGAGAGWASGTATAAAGSSQSAKFASAGSSSASLAAAASMADAEVGPTADQVQQPAEQQQQQGLWTSASQLHGLDLNLQLEAAAGQSSSNSSGEGSLMGNSRTASPEPELVAAAHGSSHLQQPLLTDEAVAAAAAAAGVSSSTVAQQLAQLALQQQIAAGMDLQLLMHQQQAQAFAASQRLQPPPPLPPPQQQQQQAHAMPPRGPVRTQKMQQQQQRRQQQQALQQQRQHMSDGTRQSGGPGLINVYVVSSLMLAYERAGKWQACVGALARGAALGVAPTAAMYNTAISAAGKAGQLAVADALFTQARASGIAHHTTYETMVAVLGMAGDPARAEVVLRAMQSAGFRPGDFAYCGLIAGYSLIDDAVSAQRVRARIVREQGPGSVSVHVYNALLAAADRAGAYDKALELLRCMRREGVEANALTQQLASEVGRKGAVEVEGQQLTAAALSAAMAAAGTLLMRSGVW